MPAPEPGRVHRGGRPGEITNVPAAHADLTCCSAIRTLPAADLARLPVPVGRRGADVATGWPEAITTSARCWDSCSGRPEAPMMISTLAPKDHLRTDGSIATERLSSAGRPGARSCSRHHGRRRPPARPGQAREIVVRGSLVMAGYYKDPEAHAEAFRFRLAPHRRTSATSTSRATCSFVDRAKDMIITRRLQCVLRRGRAGAAGPSAIQDCAGRSGCPTANGRAGHRRGQPHPGRTVTRRPRYVPSSRTGWAGSRPPSRSKCGPTCPAPRWARSSRPTSRPPAQRTGTRR